MAIEMVDFPVNSMVMFHCYVSSPGGNNNDYQLLPIMINKIPINNNVPFSLNGPEYPTKAKKILTILIIIMMIMTIMIVVSRNNELSNYLIWDPPEYTIPHCWFTIVYVITYNNNNNNNNNNNDNNNKYIYM